MNNKTDDYIGLRVTKEFKENYAAFAAAGGYKMQVLYGSPRSDFT